MGLGLGLGSWLPGHPPHPLSPCPLLPSPCCCRPPLPQVLEALLEQHALPGIMLEWRKVHKLLTGFLVSLLEDVTKRQGLLQPPQLQAAKSAKGGKGAQAAAAAVQQAALPDLIRRVWVRLPACRKEARATMTCPRRAWARHHRGCNHRPIVCTPDLLALFGYGRGTRQASAGPKQHMPGDTQCGHACPSPHPHAFWWR